MSAWGAWVLASEEGGALSHVLPHEVFRVGGHGIANHLVMLVAAAALMLLVFPWIASSRELVPRGPRNFFESILQYIREDVARPIIFHNKGATCWQSYVKGHVHQVNSLYNNWRFDTIWLDK